jgi:hypothetical protein
MSEDTTTLIARRPQPESASAAPAERSRAEEISAQAAGWQNVVQHARDNCRQGEDAVKELQRRHNKSGE